ncbi:O-antigen biosynthesis protein WlbG [soil metagenome]
MLRRAVDVALAGSALLMGAPLLGLLSVAIRLDSPGPALFRQTRVGLHRRPIDTIKLRTMSHTVEQTGSQVTTGRDPRITRLGRWLRKTKLDELPQLWNVVRGEMSLVGPRPEVPRYASEYRAEWLRLFEVRPGLTDLASITFRDEETLLSGARDHERAYREVIMPLKLALALEGVEHRSLRYDFAIMARTVAAIVRGPGVRERAVVAQAARLIAELDATRGAP